MKIAPPGGFTLSYFQGVYGKTLQKEDISERINTSDVFRKTHRGPTVLTTKRELAYVWNAVCCTCCTLFTDEQKIYTCDNNNDAIIGEIRKAKEKGQYYDLVFIEYKQDRVPDIDRLIADVRNVSPETKVFLLTFFDDQVAEELRSKGYFAISGHEMMDQARYDFLIAEALRDEGIERLRKD